MASEVHHQPDGTVAASAGSLVPQGRVTAGDRTGRFDDVVGRGFLLASAIPFDAFTPVRVVSSLRGTASGGSPPASGPCHPGAASPLHAVELLVDGSSL